MCFNAQMFKPVPIYVGLRYTRARRRNHFISFISLTSMMGLTLGVAVLIIVLSVMNGFDRELRQRILGMLPHATVTEWGNPVRNWRAIAEQAEAHPEIEAAAPFVFLQGMMTMRGAVHGALVYGVDPAWEPKVSIISQHMLEGSLDDLDSGGYGVILGQGLARRLRVGMGDRVTLVLPEASVSPAGVFPRLRRLTVKGIFGVGAELDASHAFVHLEDGARLASLGQGVHGLRLKLFDLFDAPRVSREFSEQLGEEYAASDWTRQHGNLFQAIRMEKTMIALLLLLIVAVAAFNIVSTLVMLVTDKRADIAILRAMGASRSSIMGVFMVQGTVVGVVGTLAGTALGVLGALSVSDLVAWLESALGMQFLSSDVYFISDLPSELRTDDVIGVTLIALTLSFLATLYPAWRASRTQPAEALRYE